MKKKSTTENKKKKKEIKKAEKEKKRYETALEWSNIEMVEGNAIYLKDGNKEEKIIGIRVSPRNIFIDTVHVQRQIINNLRIVFNKIRFRVYWGFVFVPVQIDDHITQLMNEEQQEEDPRIRGMIQNDFEKATWFQDTHRELEFFLMIRHSDEKQLYKNFDELVAEMRYAGFQTKTLNQHDFFNYIAYMYENPLINDFYFSRGIFSCLMEEDEVMAIEDEIHEPEFTYDEYYEEKEESYVE